MSETQAVISEQAQAVCVVLAATCAKLDAQGCDKRAVIVGMTAYLGTLIQTVAQPSVVLPLLREVQTIMAECALAGIETSGRG